MTEFRDLGIEVLAASVDSAEDAAKFISALNLSFPVAYGLDAIEVGKTHGAFWDAEKLFIHATGFIIKPNGKLFGSVYSSGALGRYKAEEVLMMLKYLISTAK